MQNKENLVPALQIVDQLFREVSHIMTLVDQSLIRDSFQPLGDSSVFWDVSAVFDRGAHWLPNYSARAYTKGKKPDKAAGYCIHFGPYSEPGSVAYLKKSNLTLPFVSISCLRDMKPGPLELDRSQIWDRLWDSGWCAENEDRIEGSLRVYRTTKDISGFQATIIGCLLDLTPGFSAEESARHIAETLFQLHDGRDAQISGAKYLWPQAK